MCATCVYYFLPEGPPVDLDEYFRLISKSFDVTRISRTNFLVRFSANEAVLLNYWRSGDDQDFGFGDQYAKNDDGTANYIRPGHVLALTAWHIEHYRVEPDHVLGSSNTYRAEFLKAYAEQPRLAGSAKSTGG